PASFPTRRSSDLRHRATRCCWPPESSSGLWERRSWIPARRVICSNHVSSPVRPARRRGRVMFSRAVSAGIRLNSWKTKPTRSRRTTASLLSGSSSSLVSPSRTVPAVGRTRPAAHFSSVLFPDPEGPMTAVNVPCSKVQLTSRSAATATPPSPSIRLTSENPTAPMKEFHAPQYFSLAEVRTHRNSNFRLHAWHYPGTPFSGWGGHYPESITPFRKSPPYFR